jgi:TonB family protein
MRHVAITLVSVVSMACVDASPAQAAPVCEDSQWRQVLRLGELTDDNATRQLDEYASRREDTPVTLLARHLVIVRKSSESRRATVEPRPLGPLRFEPTTRGRTVAGTVAVHVTIDRNGCVTEATVLRKHPDDTITEQARNFIVNVPFAPATKDGVYVSGQTTVVAPIHVR